MTRTKTLFALTLVASLGMAQAAHAGVEWSISLGQPAPVMVSAPVYAPTTFNLPSIEQTQAQQIARIQWGAQVGLITAHEYNRLQQTQGYIEQQRQWAYADGWLTYDEHINLISLLNSAGEQIERSLVNWQRVNTVYYPMPPALTVWNAPRRHDGHRGGQRQVVAVPVQPIVQPHHRQQPGFVPTQPGVPLQYRQPAAVPAPPPAVQPQQVPSHPRHGQRDWPMQEGR
jgi:hypothetical protein